MLDRGVAPDTYSMETPDKHTEIGGIQADEAGRGERKLLGVKCTTF